MPGFVISSNLPGYLPMDDDPLVAPDDWQEAWEAFQEFAKDWAKRSDESHEEIDCEHTSDEEHTDECYGSDVSTVDGILADLNVTKENSPLGYHIYVNSNDGRAYVLFCQYSYDATPTEN